jgi:hypothetical protein
VLEQSPPVPLMAAILLLAVVAGGWSYAIGINTFSLHSMYGNRLVRAYLGASTPKRRPHWFTGFDEADNRAYADMVVQEAGGPPVRHRLFHIVNVALNLVKPAGDRLEWQERKAASFTLSPLHCGSAALGKPGAFIPTPIYGDEPGGLSLGRAMATSGAAASPNMGYHSSTAVAFVMTFFNVRLGWWMPNPLGKFARYWPKREPRSGIKSLLAEALGTATAHRKFVYLSDGGHFENLGLYEMLRRRCHRIVVVDASCDGSYEFDDLQGALRKIQIDFGVAIEFEEPLPTPDQAKRTGRHVAVARIRYDRVDAGVPAGRLVYIKPVLVGDEPLDVTCYAVANKKPGSAFPHQSTADQFFDESQYESYRALGFHSVKNVFHGWRSWTVDTLPPRHAAAPVLPAFVPKTEAKATEAGGAAQTEAQFTAKDLAPAAGGFQTISNQALIAAALTVGAITVTGTLTLRNPEVTLKEGATVSLVPNEIKIAAPASAASAPQITTEVSIELTQTDLKPVFDQLVEVVKTLEQLKAADREHNALLIRLNDLIRNRDSMNVKQIVDALEKIQTAIQNIKIQHVNPTVGLDGATKAALETAAESLKRIERAVQESHPHRNIRPISEGSTK